MRNLIKFKFLYYLFSILFCSCYYGLIIKFAIDLKIYYPSIHWFQQVLSVCVFYLMFRISYNLSVIVHEIGHFFAGLYAGLCFEEFCVYPISITFENKRLHMKFKKKNNDIAGFCAMIMKENIAYNNQKLKLYVLSGMIFNLLTATVSLIFLMNTNSIFVKDFLVLMIVVNLGSVLFTLIPHISNDGIESDTLRFINACKYPDYFQKNNAVYSMYTKYENGESLQNLQLKRPENFNTFADVLLGILFIDKLIDNEQYLEAKNLIKKIKQETGQCLPKQLYTNLSIEI